jgi:hypothetical protein
MFFSIIPPCRQTAQGFPAADFAAFNAVVAIIGAPASLVSRCCLKRFFYAIIIKTTIGA